MNKKILIKYLFSIFLAIIILAILIKQVRDYNISEIIKINIYILLFSLIFFSFIKLVNTIRYAYLCNIKFAPKLFFILCYSNMMLSILPFRTGELSYIRELKKNYNKSYKNSAKNLIILRFLDYVVIFLIFLISSLFVAVKVRNDYVKIISIIFFISLIVFFILLKSLKSGKIINITKNKKINKLFKIFNEGSQSILKTSKKEITILFLISFIYWILRLMMGYIILLMLGVKLSFAVVIFISLLMLLIGLLPINTIGSFGIFEGGWTYFLVNFGYSYNQALPLSIQYHVVLFIVPLIYGVTSYLILKIRK
jgi:glycosyltransferase 2 family protein